MSDNAQKFIDALHRLERDADADAIAALFADGASISNPLVRHEGEGAGGAHAFWSQYRASFTRIASEFRTIVEQGDLVMLEWVSEGATVGGEVRYGGVSVLEHGAGGIRAFRTYFDPTPIGRTLADH